MATRSTKAAKTTPEPAVPTPSPPLTDEQIVAPMRFEADREQNRLTEAREQFLARFAVSPSDAIESFGPMLIELEAQAKEWAWVAQTIKLNASLAARIMAISDHVAREERNILDRRPWEANSTSAMANAARLYRTSARARTLEKIGIYAYIAMDQMREREKGEVRAEATTETTP